MASPIITGIGFSTKVGSQGLVELDSTLARFEELGMEFAELSLFDEDLICGGHVLEAQLERLKTICKRRDLRYTVHGPLCANFMDEAHLALHQAVCRAMLEVCADIDSHLLVLHGGRAMTDQPDEIDRLRQIEREALYDLGEYAAQLGVKIALENLFVEQSQHYTHDPYQLAQTLAAIDHPFVCATLDFSHAYIMATVRQIDYIEALTQLAPYVNHLHVHDSFGRPSTLMTRIGAERMAYGMGDLHLPIGWGSIPWQRLSEQLRFRPETAMIVELPWRYWAELESCLSAARELQDQFNRRG